MASLDREIVWLGHDNEVALILKSNGSAVDLSGSTLMTINITGSQKYSLSSTNATDAAMSWNQAGYSTGEVRIHLGSFTSLAAGDYDARIVVYDSGSTDGIVWGDSLPLTIKASPETT